MRRVERLWIQAMEEGIDDRLVKVLVRLKILKRETWRQYMEASHTKLLKHREDKWKRQANPVDRKTPFMSYCSTRNQTNEN